MALKLCPVLVLPDFQGFKKLLPKKPPLGGFFVELIYFLLFNNYNKVKVVIFCKYFSIMIKIKKPTHKVKKETLIGKVTHYFSEIKVAVIKLKAPLSIGDEIRIIGGESTDFNQEVTSMQVDHKPIKKAKKGESVGLKTKKRAREDYKVYKI